MIRGKLTNIAFQTFFVSREISNCPQIVELIGFCKKLDELKLLKDSKVSISMAYGRRMLINAIYTNFVDIKQDDIIEIVDYDPIKNVMLAIGKKEPCIETPVHWIVQKARNDVNAVVLFNNKKIFEKLYKNLPTTENEAPSGTIDLAKEVLKKLREGKNILIKNKGALFVGVNLKEIEDFVLKIGKEGLDES